MRRKSVVGCLDSAGRSRERKENTRIGQRSLLLSLRPSSGGCRASRVSLSKMVVVVDSVE